MDEQLRFAVSVWVALWVIPACAFGVWLGRSSLYPWRWFAVFAAVQVIALAVKFHVVTQ